MDRDLISRKALLMGFIAYIIGHCAGRDKSLERAEALKTVQMLADKNLLRLKEDGRLTVDAQEVEKLLEAMREEKGNDAE